MIETADQIVMRYTRIWGSLRHEQRTDQKWKDLVLCCRTDLERVKS